MFIFLSVFIVSHTHTSGGHFIGVLHSVGQCCPVANAANHINSDNIWQ